MVIGNVLSYFVRRLRPGVHDTAFRALMLHLSVSDCGMNVYLSIISMADLMFQGRYQWQDPAWRQSDSCHLSAFLSVQSSHVSAGIVCLVMLDSVVTCCIHMARVRFQQRSVHLSSIVKWVIGVGKTWSSDCSLFPQCIGCVCMCRSREDTRYWRNRKSSCV